MAKSEKILIPDIGGAEDVDVIEILVQPGDHVAKDDALITLEGDKASMEIPAPVAGVVDKILLKVGDKVAAGHAILSMQANTHSDEEGSTKKVISEDAVAVTPAAPPLSPQVEMLLVPDLGGAANVDVIELHIKKGDQIEVETPLVTLEGEKASMEIPATCSGKVLDVLIKVGDKVSVGSPIVKLAVSSLSDQPPASAVAQAPAAASTPTASKSVAPVSHQPPVTSAVLAYASPVVRRLAHELDIDLSRVQGTGAKGRITKDDVKRYLSAGSHTAASSHSMPYIDFSQFGPVESASLSKIQKLSGANLARNWAMIPHVTQFDSADVTELEAFRQQQKSVAAAQGIKLTPIVFIMKAVVAALKAFPHFNASLNVAGDEIILKSYYHIGVAVDTPKGLVVPVIRDVDQKSLFELAQELGEISKKAREKGLSIQEMQGGCFTISSLGGIGGTAFTPIINAPEVAILGVSRLQKTPQYNSEGVLEPRLMMPLSVSYDHRVIDGANGARFIVYLASRLADLRTLLL